MTPLKFVSVGFDHIICINRIVAIISPTTACGRRYLKRAKDNDAYVDCCLGKSIKSLLLLDDGRVVGSHISSKTLCSRFNGEKPTEGSEDEGD